MKLVYCRTCSGYLGHNLYPGQYSLVSVS